MKKLAIIVIALFCAAAAVSAQVKQRIAVLPSVGDLDPPRLILLTDKVREIATENLPMEDFTILKQDVITKLIGAEELYRACKEGVCIGDLAKKTDANYGARCDVVKLDDNRLVLKFEIYSVNEEAIFETFTDYNVNDFYGMLDLLEKRLPATFKKVVKASEKALADARAKAKKQQKQETKTQQETAQVQPTYITDYRWVDESGDKPRILQNRISIEMHYGLALYYSYKYSYDVPTSPDLPVRKSGETGGGIGSFRFHQKYTEFYMDMFILPEFHSDGILRLDAGLLAKYPFVFDQVPVKVTPILGVGGFNASDNLDDVPGGGFIFGGRIDVGITKIAYLRSEYLQFISGDNGGMSLKAGGGLDIGWGKKKKAFWRAELMYNLSSAYISKFTGQNIYGEDEKRVDGKSVKSCVDIRGGIGYKWGGGKNVPIKIQVVEVE